MAQAASLAVGWLLRGVAYFGLWMVLVDSRQPAELVAGAVCAAAAATLSVWVQQMRRVGVRPRIGMLRRTWRLGLDLFVDTGRLSAALFRHLVLRRPVRGRLRAARYRATAGSPQAAGRRALSEWLGSVGPNRYVVGIDRERELIIVHELVTTDEPLDRTERG
jgi:hypothetical protein